MNLSEHFTDVELRVAGREARIVNNAMFLCQYILEPLREIYGPILINSGYRDPACNESAGGVLDSYHLYEDDHAAVDFKTVSKYPTLDMIFNYMRLKSTLPFDHVILEHDTQGVPVCIHVQVRVLDQNRRPRGAYLRATGAAVDTKQVDCVAT